MKNLFHPLLAIVLVFSVGACGKKKQSLTLKPTPGNTIPTDPTIGRPQNSPAPPPTNSLITVLEGTWKTRNSLDGKVRTMVIRGNVMTYKVANPNNALDTFEDDYYFETVQETSPNGYMTHKISYTDMWGEELEPEIFRLDQNPISVVIGPSESEYRRYYKE